MSAKFYNAFSTVVSDDNKIENGGLIDTFVNNTTTLKTTWQDEALTVPHANPIVLNAAGRWPEIFAADSDVFTLRLRDSGGATIIGTIDDYSGVSEFALSSSDVLAALAGNAAAVIISGSSMSGSAFLAFSSAFDLSSGGSIDASAGSIILGSVSGATTFDAGITLSGGNLLLDTGDVTLTAGDLLLTAGDFDIEAGEISVIKPAGGNGRVMVVQHETDLNPSVNFVGGNTFNVGINTATTQWAVMDPLYADLLTCSTGGNVAVLLGDFTVTAGEVFLNLPLSAGTAGSLWNNAGVVNVA